MTNAISLEAVERERERERESYTLKKKKVALFNSLTQYICQIVGTKNNNVLANNAKAYLMYANFNFPKINNKDGETI